MFDKHAQVRLDSLQALKLVYNYSTFINNKTSHLLNNFTARFGMRIVEMTSDENTQVRVTALEIMSILQHSGQLEDQFDDEEAVFTKLQEALFDDDGTVRRASARFVIEALSNFDDVTGEQGSDGPIDTTPQVKQRAKNQLQDLVTLALTQLKEVSNGEDISLDEAKELRGSIDHIVDAFAGISSLQNWHCITELLKSCKSAKAGAAGKKIVLEDNGFVLLARLFQQSAKNLLTDTGLVKFPKFRGFAEGEGVQADSLVATKMKQTELDALTTSKDECSAHLAKVLPELLGLFRTDDTISEDLLDICQHMNLDVYLRRHKDFDSLLDQLRHHFLNHPSTKVPKPSIIGY